MSFSSKTGLNKSAAFDDEGRPANRDARPAIWPAGGGLPRAGLRMRAPLLMAYNAAPRVLFTVLNLPLVLPDRFNLLVLGRYIALEGHRRRFFAVRALGRVAIRM
jgi:hypothetical protein